MLTSTDSTIESVGSTGPARPVQQVQFCRLTIVGMGCTVGEKWHPHGGAQLM